MYNSKELAEVLCKFGADINIYNENHDSPLHFAAFKNHVDVGRVLIT